MVVAAAVVVVVVHGSSGSGGSTSGGQFACRGGKNKLAVRINTCSYDNSFAHCK